MTGLATPFRIIAHRGASGYAPENTMAAFERAVEIGVVEVETDVCLTKDGHVILLHDDTLERTTNGRGRPEDFTLEELKRLDAGSWSDPWLHWDGDYAGERIPTLDELLDRFGDTLTYHLELKKPMPGLVQATLEKVAERGLSRNVFVFAVDQEVELLLAKRMQPDIRVAWAPEAMLSADPFRAADIAAAHEFSMLTLNASNQSRAIVDYAHSLGLEARSSGISDRAKMIAAAELGCNGMTINWPDWLIDYAASRP